MCFNPWFVGLMIKMVSEKILRLPLLQFQPLICWINDKNLQRYMAQGFAQAFQPLICWINDKNSIFSWVARPLTLFQPLICWINDKNASFLKANYIRTLSFNPWFVGLMIKMVNNADKLSGILWFQPLICWINDKNLLFWKICFSPSLVSTLDLLD